MGLNWRRLAILAAYGLVAAGRVMAAEPLRDAASIAHFVPADARLFLAIENLPAFLQTRPGRQVTELLAGLVAQPTTRPASQPATRPAPTWQQDLGEKLGIENPRAAQLLFGGRLAIAADGWSGIGDAILLAEPADPAALEGELQGQRVPETAQAKVRRYHLTGNHELACDGKIVAVGGQSAPPSLYARTLAMWSTDNRVTLADLAEFRERLAGVPAESHVLFYTGTGMAAGPTSRPANDWSWLLPNVKSAAVGVVLNGVGMTVETSSRLAAPPPDGAAPDPPIDSILRLPASTLAAWTWPIRYAEEYRRLEAADADGTFRFYIDLMQAGLPPDTLQTGLLGHLVGDTIVMIGYLPLPPAPGEPAGSVLLLPTAALAVETDDPDSVAAVAQHVIDNLLRLLNLQPLPDGPLAVRESTVPPHGPTIRSLPVGRLFATQTACEFLRSLEISWTVADRWLILATHPDVVRQIIEVRRGGGQAITVGGIQQTLQRVKAHKGSPQMAMVARPVGVAGMLDSWIQFIARKHPDMLRPDWWGRLRRRQLASGVQLGIVPGRAPTTQPGVPIERTLPGWPAHDVLRPGDRILAVDGHEVDPRRPLPSLRELVANRPKADTLSVRVLREGQEAAVQIHMPVPAGAPEPIQPFDVLEKLADLLRVFSSASYVTWQPAPNLLNARLELELSAPATQTAPPPATAPASAPGTAPATQTAVASAPASAPTPAATQPASGPATQVAPATQPGSS